MHLIPLFALKSHPKPLKPRGDAALKSERPLAPAASLSDGQLAPYNVAKTTSDDTSD